MKPKLNYSQNVEQEQDIFRYVKNSELTREIRCHSDRIFPNLHQCYQWYSPPPPLSNYVLFLAILPVFGSFPRCCCQMLTCLQSPIALSVNIVEISTYTFHDDVIERKYFLRYWPFVREIHRSPVNSPQRPVTRSFDIFFDLCLNNRLSKQSWGWWFAKLSRPLWRHRNVCSPFNCWVFIFKWIYITCFCNVYIS